MCRCTANLDFSARVVNTIELGKIAGTRVH